VSGGTSAKYQRRHPIQEGPVATEGLIARHPTKAQGPCRNEGLQHLQRQGLLGGAARLFRNATPLPTLAVCGIEPRVGQIQSPVKQCTTCAAGVRREHPRLTNEQILYGRVHALVWCSELSLSKQDLMSPSSIHCGLVLFESTVAHCSIASAQLRSFRNPYEFGSASVSAMGSRACRCNACMALSFIVEMPRGRFFPLGFGMYTRRNGSALYPRRRIWCMAIPLLSGSFQRTLATPGVFLPWFSVTRRTARALPLNEWVSRCCKACTLCHLPSFVAFMIRACSRRTVSLAAFQLMECQSVEW
jgi:hypothetical protein